MLIAAASRTSLSNVSAVYQDRADQNARDPQAAGAPNLRPLVDQYWLAPARSEPQSLPLTCWWRPSEFSQVVPTNCCSTASFSRPRRVSHSNTCCCFPVVVVFGRQTSDLAKQQLVSNGYSNWQASDSLLAEQTAQHKSSIERFWSSNCVLNNTRINKLALAPANGKQCAPIKFTRFIELN